MSQELMTVDAGVPTLRKPQDIVTEARERANVLMQIVNEQHLSKRIGNKDHIQVEAWLTVGRFFNCSAGADEAEPVEVEGVRGAKAHAKVTDERSGLVVSEAIAYCMRDEASWKDKPWFQLASMAQTRAMSKALANKFRWVAVLSGFSGTPAEEMTGDDKPTSKPQPTHGPVYPFGKDKGKPLGEVPMESLSWAMDTLRQNVEDKAKAKYKEKNQALLKAMEEEVDRRQPKGSIMASDDEWNTAQSLEMDLEESGR